MILRKKIAFITVLVLSPSLAEAYVGPGAGLTGLGTVFAFIGSILLLVAGFVWYPLKRLFRKNISTNKRVREEKVVLGERNSDNESSV